MGPVLAPVWIAGLMRLFGDPELRAYRFLGWTWVVLAVLFMATGGKPYYLAGLLALLLAAGAVAVDRRLDRGRARARRLALAGAVAASAGICGAIGLPLLAVDRLGPVIAANPDVDNEENGTPVWSCTGPREPWPELWPRLRRYG